MPRGKIKTKNIKVNLQKDFDKKVKSKKSEIAIEKELEKEIENRREKTVKSEEKRSVGNDGVEKDKRLIMWAGVVFFMSIILVVWVLNINAVFKNISNKGGDNGLNLDKITESYNKTLDDLSKNLNKINTIKQDVSLTATSTPEVVQDDTSALDKENIGALKLKIEELEKKLNSSSTPSSGLPSFE